jgi:hypothetical protein
MRSSYSQNNTYKKCSEHWNKKYVEKWESPVMGASLFFGTAIDNAVTALLRGKENFIEIFTCDWLSQQGFSNKTIQIFDNPEIVYSHFDFDASILTDFDHTQLWNWADELDLEDLGHSGVDIYKNVAKIKKNPYKHTTKDQLTYFNRACWLSLLRKGELLLTAFKEQFYPKIKKVHATQMPSHLRSGDGEDSMMGFLDMILEIEGYDKPIIFDLKTAAKPYTDEQLKHSDQLTLYSAMKGQEYNTNLVGYVVLCKDIPKEGSASCSTCGHEKSGKHRTCDALLSGERCNGNWVEKYTPKPEIQVLIQEKTEKQIHDVLSDVGTVIHAMKIPIVFKNTEACTKWYGGKCPYYDACHHNDYSGLKKK